MGSVLTTATPNQQPKVLGSQQTAQRLGKSKSLVFYLVKTGQLHPQNIGTNDRPCFVFFECELEQFLKSQNQQA